MATKTNTININDHVHYAPDNLEAADASLTPTWIVTATNPSYTQLIQVGTNRLTESFTAPTSDLVPAAPTDPTETPEVRNGE